MGYILGDFFINSSSHPGYNCNQGNFPRGPFLKKSFTLGSAFGLVHLSMYVQLPIMYIGITLDHSNMSVEQRKAFFGF
jgi:hypothetical protein